MNKREHFVNSPHTGFHLNLQIIADDFAEKKEDVSILCREDPLTLDGLRIYQAGALLKPCYLILSSAILFPKASCDTRTSHL